MYSKIQEPSQHTCCRRILQQKTKTSFSKIQRNAILSDILKLETSKACLDNDIPTKIVKENADIFANVLVSNFNDSIEKPNFPFILKNATITPVFKKDDRNSKDNYRPVSILPNTSKSFRDSFFANYPISWIGFCQNTNVVFTKVTAHNIVCQLCLKNGNQQLIKENHLVGY